MTVACYDNGPIDIGYDIDPEPDYGQGDTSQVFAQNLIRNWNMEEDVDLTLHQGQAGTDNWQWMGGWQAGQVQVMQSDDRGADGSRCLVILAPNENTDCGFGQVIHGLTPGQPYKATARVKTESVSGGAGAHIALDGLWGKRSNTVTGTSDWTTVTLEFEADCDSVTLCLKLGNTAADARGVAYFDNVRLTFNTDLFIRDSPAGHFRMMFDKKYLVVGENVVDTWLGHLDQVFESYTEQFYGLQPYAGEIIKIRSGRIDAWAYAGNPIQWNENYVAASLSKVAKGDWCFGLMHEMGHDFNPAHIYLEGGNQTDQRFNEWIWNEEIFANFRMYYPLTHIPGITIIQDGVLLVDEQGRLIMDEKGYYRSGTVTFKEGEIINMYKTQSNNSYDLTVAQNRAVEMGNGMCYMLARIVEQCGWKVWQDTYKYLYSRPKGYKSFKNDWERFSYLLETLDKYAVTGVKPSKTFTTQELDVIKAYYETVNNGNEIKR